jgi:hypothetical protein
MNVTMLQANVDKAGITTQGTKKEMTMIEREQIDPNAPELDAP